MFCATNVQWRPTVQATDRTLKRYGIEKVSKIKRMVWLEKGVQLKPHMKVTEGYAEDQQRNKPKKEDKRQTKQPLFLSICFVHPLEVSNSLQVPRFQKPLFLFFGSSVIC